MSKPIYDEGNDYGLNDVDNTFYGTDEEYAQHLRENDFDEDQIKQTLTNLVEARKEGEITAQMVIDEQATVDYRNRIVMDPRILVGKPTIKGTRFPVSKILNLLGHGASFDEIVEDYPILSEEDVRAAILFAEASMTMEDVYAFSYGR